MQSVQDMSQSVPLIAGSDARARKSGCARERSAWRVSSSLGAASRSSGEACLHGVVQLDASRKGKTLVELRTAGRRSLEPQLPDSVEARETGEALAPPAQPPRGRNRRSGSGAGSPDAHVRDVHGEPVSAVRVFNLRYTTGSPSTTYVPSASDVAHLRSWLRRAYPVRDLIFASVTVDATAAWPFTSGRRMRRSLPFGRSTWPAAAIRRRTTTGSSRTAAGSCAGPPPASRVPPIRRRSRRGRPVRTPGAGTTTARTATGTAGTNSASLGRCHPGVCGESADDPGTLSRRVSSAADGVFVGVDLGDADLGIAPAALPGTAWHDVMTYCVTQWLSSYTYTGIRDRLAAEAMAFRRGSGRSRHGDPVVQDAAVVNLTKRSAEIST